MATIIGLVDIGIKDIIIQSCQLITSVIIHPYPIIPRAFHGFHFLIGVISGFLVDHLSVTVYLVIDGNLLAVHGSSDDITH